MRNASRACPRSLLHCAKTAAADSDAAPRPHQLTAYLPISRRDHFRYQGATTYYAPRVSPCPAIRLTPSRGPPPGRTTSLTDSCKTLLYRETLSRRKSHLRPECLLYAKTFGRPSPDLSSALAHAKSKCHREVPGSEKCFRVVELL